MPPENNPTKREYSTFYEKAIPIAIGLLATVVIAMLVFTILVGVGALNFG
jgi:hypothetical protein